MYDSRAGRACAGHHRDDAGAGGAARGRPGGASGPPSTPHARQRMRKTGWSIVAVVAEVLNGTGLGPDPCAQAPRRYRGRRGSAPLDGPPAPRGAGGSVGAHGGRGARYGCVWPLWPLWPCGPDARARAAQHRGCREPQTRDRESVGQPHMQPHARHAEQSS